MFWKHGIGVGRRRRELDRGIWSETVASSMNVQGECNCIFERLSSFITPAEPNNTYSTVRQSLDDTRKHSHMRSKLSPIAFWSQTGLLSSNLLELPSRLKSV